MRALKTDRQSVTPSGVADLAVTMIDRRATERVRRINGADVTFIADGGACDRAVS